MRAYLLTTGTIFGLFAAEHLIVLVRRWDHLMSDPWFVLGAGAIFLVTAGLAGWAFRLVARRGRSDA
jgi:hypothetical protein